MNCVENHELILMECEEGFGIGEFGSVGRRFKIEVIAGAPVRKISEKEKMISPA